MRDLRPNGPPINELDLADRIPIGEPDIAQVNSEATVLLAPRVPGAENIEALFPVTSKVLVRSVVNSETGQRLADVRGVVLRHVHDRIVVGIDELGEGRGVVIKSDEAHELLKLVKAE